MKIARQGAKEKILIKKPAWLVRLGPLEWLKYTYARPEGDALTLLGSVKKGLQVGALATNSEAQYFQVVGDHLTLLNTSQITKAMAKSKATQGGPAHCPTLRQATAPLVTVKKRRIFTKE